MKVYGLVGIMARDNLPSHGAAMVHARSTQNAGQDGVHPANQRVEKLRQHQIQNDNGHETCHKTCGGRLPNSGGARAAIKALIARHQANRRAKEHALE